MIGSWVSFGCVYFADFNIQWPLDSAIRAEINSRCMWPPFKFFSAKYAAAVDAYVEVHQGHPLLICILCHDRTSVQPQREKDQAFSPG